jgi:hypothetical protein
MDSCSYALQLEGDKVSDPLSKRKEMICCYGYLSDIWWGKKKTNQGSFGQRSGERYVGG